MSKNKVMVDKLNNTKNIKFYSVLKFLLCAVFIFHNLDIIQIVDFDSETAFCTSNGRNLHFLGLLR